MVMRKAVKLPILFLLMWGGANAACDIVDGVGKDGSRAFVVTSAGGGTNSWDTQFFFVC